MPEIIIDGPEGRLECCYFESRQEFAPIALVFHPHPLYGGHMNNRVVYNMFHVYRRLGFSVLRFNFRGVGRSQGKYDQGQGELSDAAAALDWLQAQNPESRHCWVAGFSFGSLIAMQLLMRRPEILGFVAVSPPTNLYDFSFLAPCPSSGLILQGGQDDIVTEPDVQSLVTKLQQQRGIDIMYHVIDEANHFFEGCIEELSSVIEEYVRNSMEEV